MKILIAEDDPVSNEMLGFLLKQWGYQVVATRNGVEAWQRLQANDAPPLAILDWQMPEMDGVEVCRRVRLNADLKHVYLLILTSMSRPDEIVSGLDAGANDYIIKPQLDRLATESGEQ